MALNVNIIGKDSEGNLRALKVNSEGNLEISNKDFATESTLSIIKDNQGRLYGKYGEEWLPIPVDSTGRLLLASDVTVNAEGLTVDLGQIKQGPAGTEPWPVQLSGNIVVDTLYDAITLTQNMAAPAVDVPNRNANAILLAIISDKNKVRIYKNSLPGDFAVGSVGDIDLTNTDVSGPVFVEPLLGYHFRIFQPGGTAGLVEAPVDISLQHTKDLRIIIQNVSGETATFTVKALHFWR